MTQWQSPHSCSGSSSQAAGQSLECPLGGEWRDPQNPSLEAQGGGPRDMAHHPACIEPGALSTEPASRGVSSPFLCRAMCAQTALYFNISCQGLAGAAGSPHLSVRTSRGRRSHLPLWPSPLPPCTRPTVPTPASCQKPYPPSLRPAPGLPPGPGYGLGVGRGCTPSRGAQAGTGGRHPV